METLLNAMGKRSEASEDPDAFIRSILEQKSLTPNEYVERNFPKPMHWNDFLAGSPESQNVIDRRYSEEDLPSPQEYIDRAFQELNDPRVTQR